MNGIVLVASMSKAYYTSAVRLACSIRDYSNFPITLFTHESFVQENHRNLFDNIITNIPVHIRAKLWGISKSPYENTLYLDSDMEVVSPEFSKVFDLLEDNDLILTKIRPHVSKEVIISKTTKEKLIYHGGFIMFNHKTHTRRLMENWWTGYTEQQKNWNFPDHYDRNMQRWDQFTLWRLLKESEYNFKIKTPKNDYRWNYIHLYDELGVNPKSKKESESPIIYHYTIPEEFVKQRKFNNRLNLETH